MKRFVKMVLVGGFVYAPICTSWLIFLNPWYITKIIKVWPAFAHKHIYFKALISMLIDKLIITWPYLCCMIFSASLIQSRGKVMWSLGEVRDKLWPSIKANWVFWPAAIFMIYAFVPRFFRGVADAIFGCIWSGILSWVLHK
jgi:hypothetical protein